MEPRRRAVKFTLAQVNGGWAFTGGSAPSTHIVKPGIGRIRAQALSEHVSMRALAIAGLPVAQTQYLRFEDQDAIVVTRFDRRRNAAGSLVRVHQEDLIQAFAMDPGRRDRGRPGSGRPADCHAAAQRRRGGLGPPVRQSRHQQSDSGAPDAHGKNYSLLLAGRSASLTPLYDVATGGRSDGEGRLRYTKGAMSIGGERGFGDIEARHWEKFARAIGVPIADVRAWVEKLAHSIPPAFAQAAAEVDTDDARLLGGPVADDIAAAAEQTMAGLTAGRRARGRLRTPFVQTLPPGRVLRGATPGGQHTVVPRARSRTSTSRSPRRMTSRGGHDQQSVPPRIAGTSGALSCRAPRRGTSSPTATWTYRIYSGMAKVMISLPDDVLADLDRQAAARNLTRSRYVVADRGCCPAA